VQPPRDDLPAMRDPGAVVVKAPLDALMDAVCLGDARVCARPAQRSEDRP
jgi:hypothetical protein